MRAEHPGLQKEEKRSQQAVSRGGETESLGDWGDLELLPSAWKKQRYTGDKNVGAGKM